MCAASIPAELLGKTTLLDTQPVLVVPGWNGSGLGHWQTIWEQAHPNFRRVEQANWAQPSKRDWVGRLRGDIGAIDRRGFLVAHSLGCLAVAHWAAQATREETDSIAGAFLVAPPWLSASEPSPTELNDFLPMPLTPLSFPTILVASENDPYLPILKAARLAASWNSQFVNVGRQGHINIESGHGSWERGESMLSALIAQAMM